MYKVISQNIILFVFQISSLTKSQTITIFELFGFSPLAKTQWLLVTQLIFIPIGRSQNSQQERYSELCAACRKLGNFVDPILYKLPASYSILDFNFRHLFLLQLTCDKCCHPFISCCIETGNHWWIWIDGLNFQDNQI